MKKLILASKSPRRRELLSALGWPFEVRVVEGIDEGHPAGLTPEDTVSYIAREKADAYQPAADEVIITADTIVVVDDDILGKPVDAADACRMLHRLSGRTHQVMTAVCLKTNTALRQFTVVTDVTFKVLTDEEINYYVENYRPFDKAGAYGIQEWIGYIGVTGVNGSYFNVVGLPVQRIYTELNQLLQTSFPS